MVLTASSQAFPRFPPPNLARSSQNMDERRVMSVAFGRANHRPYMKGIEPPAAHMAAILDSARRRLENIVFSVPGCVVDEQPMVRQEIFSVEKGSPAL